MSSGLYPLARAGSVILERLQPVAALVADWAARPRMGCGALRFRFLERAP